ncbi:Ig-like domain-containing protein [candidate division KSB1 bacterium]|nr:Ig-like domain-containing protein [candidate division KSB1 bacterium]
MNKKLRFLILLAILIPLMGVPLTVFAQSTSSDNFERSTLGANWQAHSDLGISSGNLHASGATPDAWVLGVYNGTVGGVSNPDEISLTWASASDGCSASGVELGGIAIVNSLSSTANGYMIQYRLPDKIRLWGVTNGTLDATVLNSYVQTVVTNPPAPAPGSIVKIKVNAATHTFQVYVNDTLVGTVQDNSAHYDLTTRYGGVVLLSGYENDVESFAVAKEAPDTTPPAAVDDLFATTLGSTSIELEWTATGDDGTTGQATEYDVRYSQNPITDLNFNSATQASGEPAPKTSGSTENFAVSGLVSNTTYYFALKVSDGSNWSNISNMTSATTDEDGGGGGGGGGIVMVTDDFERTNIGTNWAVSPRHEILNGSFGIISGTSSDWNNLAAYNGSRAVSPVGVGVRLDDSYCDAAGATTVALGIFLDSPTTQANGYFVLRRSTLMLYSMTGGDAEHATRLFNITPALGTPVPGDVLKVMISDDETTGKLKIEFFINEQKDGQFLLDIQEPSTWYSGVLQHGAFNNNIEDFMIYSEGSLAENISVYAGNNQSGPILTTLPDSIAVQVTDALGSPAPGTVVDFELISGQADLSIDSYDYGGLIWKEVEAGILRPFTITASDPNASNGTYVVATGPNWVGGSELNLYIPESGNFDFYIRFIAPDGNQNSMFYKLDDADSVRVDFSSGTLSWTWKKFTNKTWDKGFHKLIIINRETGTQFDKVALVSTLKKPGYVPTGTGGTGPDLPNVTDDNGVAYTFVTFKTNADNNVVINATGFRDNGVDPLNGSPVVFTLDPTPGIAASLQRDPTQPDTLTGEPLKTMTTPLRAIVRDSYGNRVSGFPVNWQITVGSGTLSESQSTTNELGAAETYMTLSAQSTPYTIQASSAGLTGSPVYFYVKPGDPPTKIELVSPTTAQTGDAGVALTEFLTVQVKTEDNVPFEGFPVDFVVTQGGGNVSTQLGDERQSELTVNTDSQGFSRVEWVLGNLPGPNTVEARAEGLSGSPIVFQATGQIGAPDTLIIISGQDQTGPLGLPLQEPFVVKATDQAGNGVPNKDVEFRIIQGSGAYFDQSGITVKVLKTNAEGLAGDTLTIGNQVGQTHQVQVKLVNYPAVDPVTFSASATEAIASEILYVSGNGVKVGSSWQYQSAQVNTALAQDFVVQVNGPFGNDPISGHPVTFTVISGGGKFFGSNETTVSTGPDGRAAARLTVGSIAGDSVHVVEATAYRVDFPTQPLRNAPIIFKASATPAAANKLVKNNPNSDNQNGIVGNPLPKQIEAMVTDIYGNPIAGHQVTFEIKNNGGTLQGATGSPDVIKQVTTDSKGIASIIWIMPIAPGQVQLEARATTAGGNPLNNSPQIYTAFAGVDAANEMIRVTGTDLSGTVAKPLTNKLIVKIVDRFQNPVGGYPVTFTVTDGNGQVNGNTQATIQSATDGTAQVEWILGNESGFENNQVEATSSVTINSKIVFKASGLADVAYRLVPDSTFDTYGIVGEFLSTPLETRIVDQFSNPVSNYDVLYETVEVNGNEGYIDTLGVTTKTVKTDEDGYAEIRWGLGPNPGSQNNKLIVISKRGGIHLLNSPYEDYIVSAQAGAASRIVKITNDTTKELSSVHGSTLPEYLKVKVTDRFGTPIARHKVTFKVISRATANGGSLDGMVDTVKVKETDSNGIASVQFTLGLNAGVRINKVQFSSEQDGLPLQGSPGIFEITGLSSTATKIVKINGVDQKNGIVGQFWPQELRVAARDKNDNNVAGQPISFKILPRDTLTGAALGALGPGTATDTTINTAADGIARLNWRAGYKTGEYTVEATSYAVTQLQGSPLQFTWTAYADSTDSDQSMIAVSPDTLNVSEGTIKATITVTLKDRFGNPVQNKGVTIMASGSGNDITQPTSASDENGQVTGFISSQNSGLKEISARDINNEVDIENKAQVYFRAAEADRIVKHENSGDAQKRNIGTVLPEPLRVVVVDRFGNPIPDFPVTFTVNEDQSGGRIVDNTNIRTDINGVAAKYYRLGTQKGINLIEASAQGLNSPSVKFSVEGDNPVDLQKPKIVSGDSLKVGPGKPLPEDLVVVVNDERGWPVWNEDVEFKALGANNGAITSDNPHSTDWYGYARAKAQVGTKVGINLYNATLKDHPEKGSTTFYAWTLSATTAKYLSFVSGPEKGTVGQSLGQPFILKTSDEYGNPVSGISVTFSVIDDESVNGAGTLEGGVKVLTKTTNLQGHVSVFYTLDIVSGINKIKATAVNLEPSTYEITIIGEADSPYRMDIFSGNGQRGEMGKPLYDPLLVMVQDRHGNPAPGGVVTFTVTEGDGYIDGQQSVQSNANGLAKANWVLGPRPYATSNKLQVTSSYLIGGPLKFEATGEDQHYPEFTNLPKKVEVFETSPLTIPVSATDGDGERVYYLARNLPAGATFETDSYGNYEFRWTPDLNVVKSPDLSKTFYPVFIATDNHDPAGKVKDSVEVVVKNYNRPPEITDFWPKTYHYKFDGSQNQPIQFGVVTKDQDGDQLTVLWYVEDEPEGEGHTFTLQPASYPLDHAYSVKVKVCDALSCTEKSWWADPSSVELVSFSTMVTPYKGIVLNWETSNESGNLGFNVLRSQTENGIYEKINEKLIPSGSERKYQYNDTDVKAGNTYYYKLEDISVGGIKTHHGPVSAEAPVPSTFDLSQNFPNPFNPTTSIRFELPRNSDVTLEVYNIMGQMVRQLVDSKIEAGYHTVNWDGTNESGVRVGSGVYYYRLVAGDFVNIKKMVLLK